MGKNLVEAYLNGHAEALIHDAPALQSDVDWVVCIPACDEDARFAGTLKSLCAVDGADSSLLILVVNGAEDAPDSVHEGNRLFLEWIRKLSEVVARVL